MNDNASDIPTPLPCPPWCIDHKVLSDDPTQVVEHVESHHAASAWLRSMEDLPYFIALTMSQTVVDSEPWDPGISLYLRPESPDTCPVGLSVRQARWVVEKLTHYIEMAEQVMTDPCSVEDCPHMTVPSEEGMCDPCRSDAWRASRPRLVRS